MSEETTAAAESQGERIHLFANGTQYDDWRANNCDTCRYDGDGVDGWAARCALLNIIYAAEMDDGSVSAEDAARLGCRDGVYVWRCAGYTPRRIAAMRQRAGAWWRRGKVALLGAHGEWSLPAIIVGEWALHQYVIATRPTGTLAITHVPTMRLVRHGLSPRRSIALLRRLATAPAGGVNPDLMWLTVLRGIISGVER